MKLKFAFKIRLLHIVPRHVKLYATAYKKGRRIKPILLNLNTFYILVRNEI